MKMVNQARGDKKETQVVIISAITEEVLPSFPRLNQRTKSKMMVTAANITKIWVKRIPEKRAVFCAIVFMTVSRSAFCPSAKKVDCEGSRGVPKVRRPIVLRIWRMPSENLPVTEPIWTARTINENMTPSALDKPVKIRRRVNLISDHLSFIA